jgi:hypothetical protein
VQEHAAAALSSVLSNASAARAVAEGHGGHGWPGGHVGVLLRALDNPHVGVREKTASVLVNMFGPGRCSALASTFAGPLIRILDDRMESDRVVRNATWAVANIMAEHDDPDSDDPDSLEIFDAIFDAGGLDTLSRLETHPCGMVREQAARAIDGMLGVVPRIS